MTDVAILWHMHQPSYEDLVTEEHILPWARLHALKDYYGMAALMEEFPDVRVTFNLVPSLLAQIEAFAAGRAHDRYLQVGLKDAADLVEQDVEFMVRNFFHAHRGRMIDIYPRYAELLTKRGPLERSSDTNAAIKRFTTEDLRDLQVWQKLAWIDPFYLDGDPRVRGLVQKGRGFTEEDKRLLRTIELELLNLTIPAYRAAAVRGQVELSTSPFYHPILPLLCDTDIYRRTHPDARYPDRLFKHPEDALEQLTRAAAYHDQLFGTRPTGLWPSEGSVSDAMVPLVSQAGFSWMATDELILGRTIGCAFSRDAEGVIDEPDRLYRPYAVAVGGARVACLFRDHALSDLIGFTYAAWSPAAAADDFVRRLALAGRAYTARTGRADGVIPIILDGENAWEHYEGGGRPFLRALYGRLSGHPELRTVTMDEACRRPQVDLPGIFPGSWIDANFSIWIGHPDDQRAWGQLAAARNALTSHPGPEGPAVADAREELLVAEGSDWFWWYGDDHSSDHDLEFDDLFRRHLRNVYRLLNQPVPDDLFVSNISTAAPPPEQVDPVTLLAPTIDGEDTSYFEWLGAGSLELRDVAGTMSRADRQEAVLTAVRFGFDLAHLFVRVDGRRPLSALLAEGYEVGLTFLQPAGVRFTARQAGSQAGGAFWERESPSTSWSLRDGGSFRLAAGTILEVALPLGQLRLAPRAGVSFFISVSDAAGHEVERHPTHRPIEIQVPDHRFGAQHWTA